MKFLKKNISIKFRNVFLDDCFTDAQRILKMDSPDMVNKIRDKLRNKNANKTK